MLLVAAGLILIPDADAAENPFERGPAPSVASIAATRGPFAVSEETVSSRSVSGFGGGTIYFPTSTSLRAVPLPGAGTGPAGRRVPGQLPALVLTCTPGVNH
ncbi:MULTISPECIES: poly(ethylene terephthalate) hydrolase family protein [Micromonospora]|uniref:poly(ethylene terephthalate) hydrolase family protein n=1 Tax=Micromonospora TaxID=1873 RepID=UPI001C312081|nr:hypothetical protein [Micromonospora yangpuensis]